MDDPKQQRMEADMAEGRQYIRATLRSTAVVVGIVVFMLASSRQLWAIGPPNGGDGIGGIAARPVGHCGAAFVSTRSRPRGKKNGTEPNMGVNGLCSGKIPVGRTIAVGGCPRVGLAPSDGVCRWVSFAARGHGNAGFGPCPDRRQ